LKSDDVSDWPLPNKIPGCAPVRMWFNSRLRHNAFR